MLDKVIQYCIMKKLLLPSLYQRYLFILMIFCLPTITQAQTLIAGWDFQTTSNGGTLIAAAPSTATTLNANFGSGAIYLNGSNGSSFWWNNS